MDTQTAIVISLVCIVVSLIGAKTAVRWRQTSVLEPKIVEKRLKMQDELIYELEQELKNWKAKYSRARQVNKVEMEDNLTLTNPESNRAFVEANFEPYVSQLPKDIAMEARRHKAEIIEFLSNNPDVLKRFIKTEGNQAEPQSGTIPQFDIKGAV